MVSPLEQKAVEIIGQLQQLAPRATELALETARINAWSNLLTGLVWLAVFAAAALFWLRFFWPWVQRDDQDLYNGPIVNFLAGLALALLLAVSGITALNYLSDLWTYVGIFHPELALAHKVI